MSILIDGIEMPKDEELLSINIYPNGKVAIDLDLNCRQIATATSVPLRQSDVSEAKHGKWIDAADTSGGEYYRCSECGTYIEKVYFANDYMANYCPNCGADMREIREDEQDKE